MSTLIAALRSDNPLGGAPLSYAEADESFSLQGVGEIDAAKLLDLENRRQLVWADPVTREWALELAAIRLRKEKEAAARAAAEAAEAAAAAATSAAAGATAAPQPADPPGAVAAVDPGTTVVFEPPTVAARRPAGIRAAQTRFTAPAKGAAREGEARVVWAEPPADERAGQAKVAETAAAAAWAAADPIAAGPMKPQAGAAAGTTAATGAGWSAASPGFAAAVQMGPSAPPAAADASVVTRRTDRRSARREAEHRRATGAVWLRILLYVLIAIAVAVVLILMQQGTIGF